MGESNLWLECLNSITSIAIDHFEKLNKIENETLKHIVFMQEFELLFETVMAACTILFRSDQEKELRENFEKLKKIVLLHFSLTKEKLFSSSN